MVISINSNINNINDINTIKINKEQKKILCLLSVGTFLEYFDLMLYIHMMLFLNEIFFPTNISIAKAKWLNAFTFCSTYILRPFGAIILGFIGDKVGRKSTIVIATFMMSFTCIVMANLPTYAQIGITASIVVTICRAIQGMSSIGEFIGAQLYINEVFKPPLRYVGIMLMPIASVAGTAVALYLASKVISNNLNWRYLFWFGGFLAIIGFFARTKLSETTEFIKAKTDATNNLTQTGQTQQSINFKTIVAIFLLNSSWPISSYFCYVYAGSILKNQFMLSSGQILQGNFIISLANLSIILVITYYVYKINPLKLAKCLLIPFIFFSLTASVYLSNIYNSDILFITRLLVLLFSPYSELVAGVSFKYVPVLKRLTYIGLAFSLSNSIFYCIAPFLVTYMMEKFNYWGLTIINLLLASCFLWSVVYFEKLEKLRMSSINLNN